MKKMLFALTITIVLLGLSLSAQAATETTTMQVSGTVPPVVTVSATSLNFGAMNKENWTGAEATITVNAPSGTIYHIALNGWLGPTPTIES